MLVIAEEIFLVLLPYEHKFYKEMCYNDWDWGVTEKITKLLYYAGSVDEILALLWFVFRSFWVNWTEDLHKS